MIVVPPFATAEQIDAAIAEFVAECDAEGLASAEALDELRHFIRRMSGSYILGGVCYRRLADGTLESESVSED